MIPPPIYTHVGCFRHMAVYTLGPRIIRADMKMMARIIIGLRCMTGCTQLIAIGFQSQAVRFVTIATAHAALIHLTLHKRAINIDLVLDLAIGMVESLAKNLGLVVV